MKVAYSETEFGNYLGYVVATQIGSPVIFSFLFFFHLDKVWSNLVGAPP